MVKSSVTLVRICPLGLACNVRQLQEMTLRVIGVFQLKTFCDFGAAGNHHLGICEPGRLWQEGDKGLEVKLPRRSLWGQE